MGVGEGDMVPFPRERKQTISLRQGMRVCGRSGWGVLNVVMILFSLCNTLPLCLLCAFQEKNTLFLNCTIRHVTAAKTLS